MPSRVFCPKWVKSFPQNALVYESEIKGIKNIFV